MYSQRKNRKKLRSLVRQTKYKFHKGQKVIAKITVNQFAGTFELLHGTIVTRVPNMSKSPYYEITTGDKTIHTAEYALSAVIEKPRLSLVATLEVVSEIQLG